MFSAHLTKALTWDEMKQFFNEFRKNPATVGAIAPSSSLVGTEITKYFVNAIKQETATKTIHVLEVGAGTGCLTKVIEAIVDKNHDIDIKVDVVEISPEFCTILRQKFENNQRITIHCKSIINWNPDYRYDFIICTLPFNSFESTLMKSIIEHLQTLIYPGGVLSYVAYAGIADIKKHFLWGNAKKQHLEKINTLKSLRKKYQIDARTVIVNCPPIRIYHLEII